jgi:hypothetical protein
MRLLISFFKLNLADKKLLLKCVFYLFFAKVYLYFVPYKKWIANTEVTVNESKPIDFEKIKKLKWFLLRANKVSFWKNKCIVMVLAARFILKKDKIHSSIHLSVNKDRKASFKAHAFLYVDDFQLVSKNSDYVKII